MNILFVCAGGMSSSLTADKLVKTFLSHGEEVVVDSCGEASIRQVLEAKKYQLVLVAPQIKYKFKELEKVCVEKEVKIINFPMTLYAPTPGNLEKLYLKIQELVD